MSFGCFQPQDLMWRLECFYHKAVAMEKKNLSIWPNKCVRFYFLTKCLCIGSTTVKHSEY